MTRELRIRKWLPLAGAVLIYLAMCWALGVGTAGPEEDETLSYDGAARLALGQANPPCRPATSFPFLHHCWPLMVAPYVGAPKDYFLLPAFLVFGAHVAIARMGVAVLGAVGIAGVFLFLGKTRDRTTAIIAAYVLAIHPSYIDLPLFDRGNIACSLAVLGLSLALLSAVSAKRFFALGFVIGLGVWARMNFSWIAASALVAVLLTYRRDVFRLARYLPALAAGMLVGVLPALAYLRGHARDLMSFVQLASGQLGFRTRLGLSFASLRDVLFADMEQRTLWGGDMVPAWQSWLALGVALAALLWCFLAVRTRVAVALAITTSCLAVFYLTSRLPVAEHHLVILVPLVVMVVAIAASDLLRRNAATKGLAAAFLALYAIGRAALRPAGSRRFASDPRARRMVRGHLRSRATDRAAGPASFI